MREKIRKKAFFKKMPNAICVWKGKETAFSCTGCFGQKSGGSEQPKPGNTIKNSGFRGSCQKPKLTPFFSGKGALGCVKKWVLLTVFF